MSNRTNHGQAQSPATKPAEKTPEQVEAFSPMAKIVNSTTSPLIQTLCARLNSDRVKGNERVQCEARIKALAAEAYGVEAKDWTPDKALARANADMEWLNGGAAEAKREKAKKAS